MKIMYHLLKWLNNNIGKPVNDIIRESHNLHKMAIQNYKDKVSKSE